ncbi:hypothetical protein D1007_56143 [Hordeum vulgare]|nr:hypothetical protein D1007_56143 [Hordeum vulgare]
MLDPGGGLPGNNEPVHMEDASASGVDGGHATTIDVAGGEGSPPQKEPTYLPPPNGSSVGASVEEIAKEAAKEVTVTLTDQQVRLSDKTKALSDAANANADLRVKIQALHLQPNSILLLAIFTFCCNAFVGMRSSVALFRHFFILRFTDQRQRSVCVSSVDVGGIGTHLKTGKKVEIYRKH